MRHDKKAESSVSKRETNNGFALIKNCSWTKTLALKQKVVQCPLDIETLDKAAALDLATATPLTDLRQYINSNLGFRDLEI